jgi:hypothetical protein
MKDDPIIIACEHNSYKELRSQMYTGEGEREAVTRTFHGQRYEIPACFRCFLANEYVLVQASACLLASRTFDHSSMSISPAVVSRSTRPCVGRAMST